jgi:hypothetical protein
VLEVVEAEDQTRHLLQEEEEVLRRERTLLMGVREVHKLREVQVLVEPEHCLLEHQVEAVEEVEDTMEEVLVGVEIQRTEVVVGQVSLVG